MNLLESIILALVIGFVVLTIVYTVISKIFEEIKRNNRYNADMVERIFEKMPEIAKTTYETLTKLDEEKGKKEREKFEEDLKREFE